MTDISPKKCGFLQALAVTAYCSLIGLFFWKANDIFGRVPNYIGPVLFLVLFVVSALICALLVFYYPYQLFLAKKHKLAAQLVLKTTIWLFIFMLIIMGIILIF